MTHLFRRISPALLAAAAFGAPARAADGAGVGAFLEQHCVQCHGPDKQKGDLRLDTLGSDFADRETAATWIEVRDQMNLGEMPPDDEPRPDAAQAESVSVWIAAKLREAERAARATGGRVPLRRMNRREYTHTVADLLQMKFPTGESPLDVLPPDGTAEGFDKVGAALLLDPSLMGQYYEVARGIAARAIVDGPPEFPTETLRMEFEEIAENRAIRYLVTRLGMQPLEGGLRLVEGGTRSFGRLKYPGTQRTIAANGFYRFTVRAGAHRGEGGGVPRMRVTQDHPDEDQELIMEVDVRAPFDAPQDYTVIIPRDTLGGEVHVQLVNATSLNMSQRPGESFMRRNTELGEAGDFAGTIRLDGRKIAEGWGGERSTPDPDKLDIDRYHQLFLDSIEIEGPLYDAWPPKSHTTLLFRGEGAAGDPGYAREIFARFLPRAWRRPIGPGEVEPILAVVQTELDSGQSFHDAVRVGLAAALTSPKFLYLVEPSPGAGPRPLDGYELASRLSYFLWNSMPDAALSELAAGGGLAEPAAVRAQVRRMLADPKAARFVESFGAQWLRTDTFLAFEPGERTYRDYDEALGAAAVREPLEFLRHLLDEKRSALEFLDSDFAMVNARLARHYGIDGVSGDAFRPAELPPGSPRGGLLGMMGVHLAGSDGVRTKPVSRAVYVREVLFNDPPDPPPPNAGEVEPNIRGERLTVRERLLQHLEIESCASCHRSLDPYGLALENFNVIGAWRDRQDGEEFRGERTPPIDASGRLPNGEPFADFAEFRALLAAQGDRFRRALAEKLFVYALGRPLEPGDDSALNDAVAAVRAGGDTFHALIESIATSRQFLTK